MIKSQQQPTWRLTQCLLQPETLYWGDDALSTKPVMHYQGTAYICSRGHASQLKVLAMATDCSATRQQG